MIWPSSVFTCTSAPHAVEAVQPDCAQLEKGEDLFEEVGCSACHVPFLMGSDGPVHLYSDLLLHRVLREFQGRGCAISQASTSMLMDMVKGRSAQEVAAMSSEELLEEVGIPLTPVRLKCALLGLGVLKLALHKGRGTPLPEEWAGLDELELS